MGYWAKDGSYTRDDSDLELTEAMNESQGAKFDREQRVIAQMEAYEAEEKRKREADRAFGAQVVRDMYERDHQRAMKLEEERIEREKENNRDRFGISIDLRNPKTLAERRDRANFWKNNSLFAYWVGRITGKNKKFNDLQTQYNKAKTDEERLQIVEEMEKMYPTRESAVRHVERQNGYRR